MTHLALRVGERAEPDLLQRGGPRGRWVRRLAEVVAPSPPGGRVRRRHLTLIRATEAWVGLLWREENVTFIQVSYVDYYGHR